MTADDFEPEDVAGWGDIDRAQLLRDRSELAYTIRHDGEVLICAGVADLGHGRGLLWSFVSDAGRRHGHIVHRAALRFISMLTFRRLEATCLAGVAHAAEWLERLGFSYEGTMRAWGPDGSDHDLYARVRA